MTTKPCYLLILACSQRKRPDPGLLPAIERYEGPQFGVLRKFISQYPDKVKLLDIYILSAKFGLIPGDQLIPNYDQKMTPKRAGELHEQVLSQFEQVLQLGYDELFISLGETYWLSLSGYEQSLPANFKVIVAQGSSGRRQAELHHWLYEKIAGEFSPHEKIRPKGKIALHGVEITLTPEQILEKGRLALVNGNNHATDYQSWYVCVDDRRVAPKWLVSQITGLPVGSFHTGDARRVLEQLGVEVRRV